MHRGHGVTGAIRRELHRGPCTLDRAVNGGAGDAEEFGDLRRGVLAASVEAHEVAFLRFGELGLPTSKLAFGLRDRHAFAGPGSDEVGFELGDHAQDVEQQFAHRVVRIVDASAHIQTYSLAGELIGDVPRVRKRAGEAVELGHHERVAVAARSQGLTQSRAVALGAGEPVVDVDRIRVHAGGREGIALGGEVLRAGRAAGVADEHALDCSV